MAHNTLDKRYADFYFLKSTPTDYVDKDEELGFLGILTAIGSAIGGGVKAAKALKKRKKKKKAAAAAKKNAKGEVVSEGGEDMEEVEDDIEDLENDIKDILATIPTTIREQLTFGLAEWRNAMSADKTELDTMVNAISKQFKPQMEAAMELLKQKQLQTVATNEHNVIVKDDTRWKENSNNQQLILNRLDLLEKRLGTDIKANESRNRKTAAAFGMAAKFGG